jgi:hypothetical protein
MILSLLAFSNVLKLSSSSHTIPLPTENGLCSMHAWKVHSLSGVSGDCPNNTLFDFDFPLGDRAIILSV